ncbi:hypothetical protein BD779DRAFT_437884 [Infundibulicybe gibba]|nr:hypothetical protein BD779DRAFT_437884 [Infundibulicybe gibba]
MNRPGWYMVHKDRVLLGLFQNHHLAGVPNATSPSASIVPQYGCQWSKPLDLVHGGKEHGGSRKHGFGVGVWVCTLKCWVVVAALIGLHPTPQRDVELQRYGLKNSGSPDTVQITRPTNTKVPAQMGILTIIFDTDKQLLIDSHPRVRQAHVHVPVVRIISSSKRAQRPVLECLEIMCLT